MRQIEQDPDNHRGETERPVPPPLPLAYFSRTALRAQQAVQPPKAPQAERMKQPGSCDVRRRRRLFRLRCGSARAWLKKMHECDLKAVREQAPCTQRP